MLGRCGGENAVMGTSQEGMKMGGAGSPPAIGGGITSMELGRAENGKMNDNFTASDFGGNTSMGSSIAEYGKPGGDFTAGTRLARLDHMTVLSTAITLRRRLSPFTHRSIPKQSSLTPLCENNTFDSFSLSLGRHPAKCAPT